MYLVHLRLNLVGLVLCDTGMTGDDKGFESIVTIVPIDGFYGEMDLSMIRLVVSAVLR
jgi:hypothetical protein